MKHITLVHEALAIFVLAVSVTFGLQLSAAPVGTAFTYQGKLADAGNPASGSYDLKFTLFDTNSGGSAVAGPLTNSPVGVTNGLFTTALDFGSGVFAGEARWLEIGVRTNGGGAFTTLSPRQPLTTWNYKSQTNTVRHLGPMAQDFHAAFGLGSDDRAIGTVDADGVALAAIQGLNQKLENKLQQKETEIAELRLRLEALEQLLHEVMPSR